MMKLSLGCIREGMLFVSLSKQLLNAVKVGQTPAVGLVRSPAGCGALQAMLEAA